MQIARTFAACLALVLLALGCATDNILNKENAAVGAGFKIITPKQPDQLGMLKSLPPNKVSQITYHGKIYYVLPDLANKQAYVGGPKQYAAYQKFRQEQNQNAKWSPNDVQVVEIKESDWSNWEGMGGPGLLNEPGEPGWY